MTGAETTRLDSQTAQHEATLRMDARAADGVDDDATMQVDAQTAVFEASAPRSPHSVRRMNLPVGYQLQEYEILQTLGNGGFGITYLARDRNLSKTVAIKEFFPTGLATRYHDDTIGPVSDASNVLTDYSHLLSRFIDEARTLAKFEHPNVVRVLRYVEANNTAYIIMEYIAGPTLAQYIREHGTLDEVELRPMLLALIDGLRVVHEHGMLHRDIKPENVMLRNGREPVLIDFGASREAIGRSIQNITMMCTPGYSPIEQMVSDDNRLGPYSDIYALGATAYTALVGSPPGKASVRVYGNGDPTVPVTQAAKGRASEGFLRAIDWAIEPSQKDRPQTTQQWLTAFNGAVLAPQSSNVKALVVRSDHGEGKRRRVGGGRGVIVGVAVGIGVIGGAVAMLGLAAFAFRSEDKAGQSPVSAAISTVTSWFKPKAPVQEPSEESSQQQSSTPEQSTTPEQTPQVVQVQPSEQDQTQTQPVAPVDPSAQTVAVASSTASPNALPQPATGVCTDPGAAPPAQGTPDFGGVRQVSCQIEGIGLTPSLAIVAALQSAVGQVNGVGVANRLQGLRAALDVDVNGAHVAAIDMRSFSQRVILASQGAITSYDVLSQQQVSNPNKSSYWKTLIRANVAKYSAPDESGRPKIIIAPPRIGATSYVVGDARVPAAEVSRAIAARLSDILTQTHRFIVLDRDFSDESQIEFDHIAGGNVRLQDAARLGEQFATDLILVPVIERFEYPRQTRQLRMSDRQLVSYSGGGRIALRLLNATTGEVVMSDTFDYTLPETTASTLPRTIDGPGIAATMMSALAGQIGDAVIGEIFPVAVVSVDGNQVILSQGGAALQPGQRWRAMALGQPLSDPQTGRSLGRDERPCCTIRIDRVAAQVSYGVVEEGADVLTTAFNSGAVVLREKTRAR